MSDLKEKNDIVTLFFLRNQSTKTSFEKHVHSTFKFNWKNGKGKEKTFATLTLN